MYDNYNFLAMKFLTGAPTNGSLDWSSDDLLDEFLPLFLRFIYGTPKRSSFLSEASSAPWPLWRAVTTVPLHYGRPMTTLDNDQDKHYHTSHASDPVDRNDVQSFGDPVPDEESEDLETSFAVHELFEPGQIASLTQSGTDLSLTDSSKFQSFADVEDTDYSLLSLTDDCIVDGQTLPTTEHLTDLSALPDSEHITRILPGTMTINIIVGVIDIDPPRTVTVRRQGSPYEMNIVDLHVRDETKAGLRISVWLKPESHIASYDIPHQQSGLRPVISRLRRGDVVFFKHVALRTYRAEVCGQSLSSERFPNNGTGLALLSRGDGMSWGTGVPVELETLSSIYRAKIERVQSWLAQYLGIRSMPRQVLGKRKLNSEKFRAEELPADTQSESET
ncbi:MAG: hypothetical protein M1822_001306 [Bathelium mastoideum]|nr:MAG: hypothetical protein M1822_001306 [Bathelium mastoideum]